MTNLKDNQPLESFDWEAFEKGFPQTNESEVYDSISDFKQGIAIVTKMVSLVLLWLETKRL